MTKPRYLTKSRYKLGLECPTKLFYTGKKEYADQSAGNPFMAALAEGGFQVGELAKYTFAGGHDIKPLDYEKALSETNELMKQDEVTIYEAAIKYENFFIRADVLVKKGNLIKLYEVKAKSFDEGEGFYSSSGFVQSGWKPYLYDVAFQKYVIKNAFPNCVVRAHLTLVNKSVACPIDGLNQKFKIVTNEGNRKEAKLIGELTENDLKPSILCSPNVDSICERIYEGSAFKNNSEMSFEEQMHYLADIYKSDTIARSLISSKCKSCQFRTSKDDEIAGLKSGYRECWKAQTNLNDKELEEGHIFDIWNFRGKDKLIEKGVYNLNAVTMDDINPEFDDNTVGISPSARQWLQVEKYINNDNTPWIDKNGLRTEMDSWKFPLHFIDFETSAVALPFFKGCYPYEGVAFQFSHHIVHEDGKVEHKGEFLNTKPGDFPNFDFVRELKHQLENDEGTVFRYAAHENTYLKIIYRQILQYIDIIPDHSELIDFIKTITHNDDKNGESWTGERDMVDMLDVVKKFYYDPYMKGSNSIKVVLPAILNSSSYLQEKYSKPIYGTENGIPSLNFKSWKWVDFNDNGSVKDPYKLLPKMFSDVSDKDAQLLLTEDDALANGGAALTAYGRMQFEEMTDYERTELNKALLKYCELDTMAMVMIYEGWREMVK